MCEVGAYVVGRWEGGWYRGRVVGVSREVGRVAVEFFDYGNVATLAKEDLSLLVQKDMERPEQAIRCRFEDTKDMVLWEKNLAMKEYKVKLVCCGVEDKQVTFLVRELEEVLLDGEQTPGVVTHVSQNKAWVPPVGTETFVQNGCKVTDNSLQQTKSLQSPITLPLNRHIKGEVSYVCSTGVVWFTPTTLVPLRDHMMDQLALLSLSPLPRLQVDQVCTTRFSLDGELYRAIVKEVSGDTVNVFFMDYGNKETKIKEEIFELPTDCMELPAAAIAVLPTRLFNLKQREEVEDLLCGKTLSVMIALEGETKFARFFIGKQETLFGIERPSQDTQKDQPGRDFSSFFCLPAGVRIPANLGYLESVMVVWVIPTNLQDDLEMVTNMLAEQQNWDKLDYVEVGTMCVARFSEDQVLYRAMVIACCGREQVMIRFVDYGNCEKKFVKELSKITPALQQLDRCAVCVRSSWIVEDTLVKREKVEVELEKEEFLVELDKHGGASFYRGDFLTFGNVAMQERSQRQIDFSTSTELDTKYEMWALKAVRDLAKKRDIFAKQFERSVYA